MIAVANGVEAADAPARLRLVFGEVLNDVAEDFEPYKFVDLTFGCASLYPG